jgi:hypothetical protein
MTTRIREQLERITDLKTKCTLTITAVPVQLPSADSNESLDQQVQSMASCVTQMILTSMDRKHLCTGKNTN